MERFKVGTKVRVLEPDLSGRPSKRFGGVWTVTKVNPTTYALTPEGGGRPLKAAHELVTGADSLSAVETAMVAIHDHFVLGSVVKIKRPLKDHPAGTLFVVLADQDAKLRIALLGGENDSYWRVLKAQVEKVEWDATVEEEMV